MNSRQYEKAATKARDNGLPHLVSDVMEALIADFIKDDCLDAVKNRSSVLVLRKNGKETYSDWRDNWTFELEPELDKGCIVFIDVDHGYVDVCTFSEGDWVDICTELRMGAEVALQKFSKAKVQ